MSEIGKTGELKVLLAGAKGAALAALFYAFHLATPFWQEDYGFLSDARDSAAAGRTLLQEFVPAFKSTFWRPLSVNLYWRFVNAWVGYNPVVCHALNLLVFFAAVTCVGWLAAAIGLQMKRGIDGRRAAFWGSLLYGVHGAFSLAVGWASGMPELLNLLFCALSLRGWIYILDADTRRGHIGGAALCLAALSVALLCKEGAVVLPALFVVLTDMRPNNRRLIAQPRILGTWGAAAGLALAWYVTRAHLVQPQSADSPYAMRVGANVFRNAIALTLYGLNVSREVLRSAAEGGSRWPLAWGAVCAAMQGAAIIVLLRRSLPKWGACYQRLIGFPIVASLPYLVVAWNSYAYYALFGLFAYAIIAALAAGQKRIGLAAALAISSSVLNVGVEYFLPYPAPPARARWAESTLTETVARCRALGFDAPQDYLVIDVASTNRLNAIGNKTGLAIRMPMAKEHILYPAEAPKLATPTGRIFTMKVTDNGALVITPP